MIVRMSHLVPTLFFFFFNDTATTEIYTLSLHDALPISSPAQSIVTRGPTRIPRSAGCSAASTRRRSSTRPARSEEHTSELQSPCNLVCRLLLEKKKKSLSYPPPVTDAEPRPSTSRHTTH